MFEIGDKNETIRTVQSMLNFLDFRVVSEDEPKRALALEEDSHLGPTTHKAIRQFQSSEGLLVDGVIGPQTLRALERAWTARSIELGSAGVDAADSEPGRFPLVRVPGDTFEGNGYGHVTLRSDVAAKYEALKEEVNRKGALLVLSAGLRSLLVPPTRNRSPTSFHYLGRAFDLNIHCGMIDPDHDPYTVERVEAGVYHVHARCSIGPDIRKSDLPAEAVKNRLITYSRRQRGERNSGAFINFTELAAEHGFVPITARPEFEDGESRMSAEWWHFQYEEGLIPRAATFGSELLRIYSEKTLEGTAASEYRERVFGYDWKGSKHPITTQTGGTDAG